jgi:WXG100 family type VII secretion target
MRQGAAIITNAADGVKAQETAVTTTMENLMVTWQGSSAQTYLTAMQDFYTECNKIINLLTQLSTDVTSAANNYDHHDNLVNQAASSMRGGFQGMPARTGLQGF